MRADAADRGGRQLPGSGGGRCARRHRIRRQRQPADGFDPRREDLQRDGHLRLPQHALSLPVKGGPDGLAVNETTDTLFVANNGPGTSTARADTVTVIDASRCNARTTSGCDQPAPDVLTGANPGGNTVDPATDTLYVTTFDSTLQVIDGSTCSASVITGCGQTTPATLGGADPYSIAINPATHTAYVGDFGGAEGFPFTISALDTATCNPRAADECSTNPATIPMQFGPYGLAVDQPTDTIYATNIFNSSGPGDTVSVINGATCNASVTTGCLGTTATVTVGSAPAGVALNERTDTIYVANSNEQTLSVIDGATCNATDSSGCGINPATVTVGNDSAPAGLAVDPATDTIYVDNTGDNTVPVIDGATCNSKITTGCDHTPADVPVGRQFYGFVSVDPSTHLVYVSDNLDDSVSIIDGRTCDATNTSGCDRPPRTVPVGGNPTGLSVDPHHHTVYVDDNGFGPVSFFRLQIPAAPRRVTARIYRGQAEVVWEQSHGGGLPIVYHVTANPACPACTGLTTPSTSGAPYTTINGLAPGQTYTFSVTATDAAGTSTPSAPSHQIKR
jgi:DNA-binding beta-propeller fold protein YncE